MTTFSCKIGHHLHSMHANINIFGFQQWKYFVQSHCMMTPSCLKSEKTASSDHHQEFRPWILIMSLKDNIWWDSSSYPKCISIQAPWKFWRIFFNYSQRSEQKKFALLKELGNSCALPIDCVTHMIGLGDANTWALRSYRASLRTSFFHHPSSVLKRNTNNETLQMCMHFSRKRTTSRPVCHWQNYIK